MASTISAGTTSTTAIVVTADTTGILALQSNNGTTALTLNASQAIGVGSTPSFGTSGQVLTSAGSAASPTWAAASGGITSGTAVATTSGTSVDFTGLPSTVKRITVMFNGVSTSGTSGVLIQLGSGSVSTSGYVSTAVVTGASTGSISSTSGYVVYTDQAAFVRSGLFIFCYMGSNIWAGSHVITASTTYISSGGGSNTLSGVLDRIRLTTGNGTDTFDAGSVNILYE
jgi:hypothetical protein